MHRGPKGGESLEDHFDALRFGLPRAPAWRTGSTAKPPAASCSAATARRWQSLGKLFKNGKVGKTYWALVEGGPAETKAASTCRSASATTAAAGG